MNQVKGARAPPSQNLEGLPFSCAIHVQRPNPLVRLVHYLVSRAARVAQRTVLLDIADEIAPAVADHFQPSPRDAAVEVARRARLISLNPMEPRAGPAERSRAVHAYLQVVSGLVKVPLIPTAEEVVGLALEATSLAPSPNPLRALDMLTDPELRRGAFRQQGEGGQRRRWRQLLSDPAVFSASARWLEAATRVLDQNGWLEILSTLPSQSTLKAVIASSRVTFLTVPRHQPGQQERTALLSLVMHHMECGLLHGDPEEDQDPPALIVAGVTGKELDHIAPALGRVISAGASLALECRGVMACDGRSLRLLSSRHGLLMDELTLPGSHPLVHAGLAPQEKGKRKAAGKKDRDLKIFTGGRRQPRSFRVPQLPPSSLGHGTLLRQTEVAHGADLRSSVQSARASLDRARGRRRRRERADLLGKALSRDGLLKGFLRVRKAGGGPGLDGVSAERFEEDLDTRISRLAAELRSGRYRPRALLRVDVPKRRGGFRTLKVAAVRDRVVQSALVGPLGALIEPILLPSVYGYRPGIGTHTAIAAVRHARRGGAVHAVKADIEACYDAVDQRQVWARLQQLAPHDQVLRVIRLLLDQWADKGNGGRPVGIAQGSAISPLLLNMQLTPLDRHMERSGVHYFRYADDLLLLGRRGGDVQRARRLLEGYLQRKLRMRLNASKTATLDPHRPLSYLGVVIRGELCRIPADRMEEFRAKAGELLEQDQPLDRRVARLNQLVEGFGNYYRLIGAGTEVDLAALDGWLATLHRRLCAREGIPEAAAPGMLRRLPRPVGDASGRLPSAVPYGQANRPAPAAREEPVLLPEASEPLELYDEVQDEPARARSEGRFFSSVKALKERQRARAMGPARLDAGWLRVSGYGLYLGRSAETVVVKRKGEIIFEAPISMVEAVHVLSQGVTLSTHLLHRLAGEGKAVLLADPSGRAQGCVLPVPGGRTVQLRRAQAGLLGTPRALGLAREVVGAKLENQRRLLLYYAKYKNGQDEGEALRALAAEICGEAARLAEAPGADALFMAEAAAARHYWRGVSLLLQGRHAFAGRNKRGARDMVNSMLNYGYALLQGQVWRAIIAAGLDPALGFLHTSRADSVGLVYDLMEEHRQPVVDRAVISWLRRGVKPGLNKAGDLKMSSRNKLVTRIEAQLDRETPVGGRRRSYRQVITDQARALGRALEDESQPYRAFRMRW